VDSKWSRKYFKYSRAELSFSRVEFPYCRESISAYCAAEAACSSFEAIDTSNTEVPIDTKAEPTFRKATKSHSSSKIPREVDSKWSRKYFKYSRAELSYSKVEFPYWRIDFFILCSRSIMQQL
jgi:hypothetical protein